MEEDIKILENIIVEYNTQVEDYKYFSVPVRLDERDIEALENLLTRYKQLEEEKEQYKNDYFNLYEQNKQYIHYLKIEELAKKIHNELDKNGITRAYQTIIDGYFDEVLGG